MENAIQAFLKLSQKHAVQFATFRGTTDQTRRRLMRDGSPEEDIIHSDKGAMLEVVVDGQIAYAATPHLTEAGIEAAFLRAMQIAKASKPYQLFPFDRKLRGQKNLSYKTPVVKPVQYSDKEIWNQLRTICERLKNGKSEIVKTTAVVEFKKVSETWVTTDGVRIEQEFDYVSSDAEVAAQIGTSLQKRSLGGLRGLSYQGGAEFWDLTQLNPKLDRAREQVLQLAAAKPCPSGLLDLILMPDQMMLQIHESIGHPLEIDRVLGDERNYAGGSFVKPKDFGNLQYGSELLNVHFDSTRSDEYAAFGADHLGHPAEKVTIIEKGKLLRGLGSLESQARSGISGCASSRASSWNRPPIDRMANLNIQTGSSKLEDMIASVEDGVLMETNNSWSIDDFRNKFQFGCEFGQRIKNGKLAEVVKNPGYRGVTVPFWTNLAAVGDGSTFGVYGTPFCGKGEPNQAIRVGHASPACLFKKIEVFGGQG